MKSDRRPGCACFSARAASSIFRQNANRVAIEMPRPMTNPAASSLADLEAAVHRSNVDAAVRAAIEALRAKVSPIEVVRFAGRGFASSYDGASGVAPRGLVALSSAANLLPFLQAQFHPLPILQAVAFVASEKKARAPPKPPLAVSGEISHLGRSFLFAARAGERREAESIFVGMLPEC